MSLQLHEQHRPREDVAYHEQLVQILGRLHVEYLHFVHVIVQVAKNLSHPIYALEFHNLFTCVKISPCHSTVAICAVDD